MSESDYLLWLSYESFGSILFSEGAKTIGSEVFQAPICATKAIHHLCSVETTIGIQQSNCKWKKVAKLKFGSERVWVRLIMVTY